MKENKKLDWKALVILILAALLLLCLAKINTLYSQNQRMQNDINFHTNEINRLSGQINSIYANVDEQMKKEASLLAGLDCSIGSFNTEKTSVSLNLSIVPKEVTDGMKAKVSVDGKTEELKKDGNTFSGTIDVGMFLLYDQYPLLTLETEAGTKTEYLENIRISYLFEKFLPSLKAKMSGRSTYSRGKLSTDMDFTLSYNVNSPDVVFTSFTLVEEIGGKEIGREDITDAVKRSGNNYIAEYKKKFSLPEKTELAVYVLAEDSLGYIHKERAWGYYQAEGGSVAEAVMTLEHIYDKSGNLLYPADSSLYD